MNGLSFWHQSQVSERKIKQSSAESSSRLRYKRTQDTAANTKGDNTIIAIDTQSYLLEKMQIEKPIFPHNKPYRSPLPTPHGQPHSRLMTPVSSSSSLYLSNSLVSTPSFNWRHFITPPRPSLEILGRLLRVYPTVQFKLNRSSYLVKSAINLVLNCFLSSSLRREDGLQ